MKTKLLIVPALLLATVASSPAMAFFWSNPKPVEEKAPDASTVSSQIFVNQNTKMNSEDVLKQLSEEMNSKILELNGYINSHEYQKAMTLSKNLLDTVKIKTGVDPKAKLSEPFYVGVKFPAEAFAISDLNQEDQLKVIQSVKDFRGGLYLDIMTLAKRVRLLYVKSMLGIFKTNGGVTKADRDKIIQDLAVSTITPIPIFDSNKNRIIIYENEFVNDDHSYLFNREIKIFLINTPELAITEEAFEKYLLQIKPVKPVKELRTPLLADCVNAAIRIEYFRTKDRALLACIETIPTTPQQCVETAEKMEYYGHKDAALAKCSTKIN